MYDLIIDDSDHSLQGQLRALPIFWKYVRPGAYYIIEDIYEWNQAKLMGKVHADERNNEIFRNCGAFFVSTRFGHRFLEEEKGSNPHRPGYIHNLLVMRKP